MERSNNDLQQLASAASHDLQKPVRKVRFFAEVLRIEEETDLNAIVNNLTADYEVLIKEKRKDYYWQPARC